MNYLYDQKNADFWEQDMILYYSKIKMMSKHVFEKNENVHKNAIEITILEGWNEKWFFSYFSSFFYMKAGQCLKDSVLFANWQVSLPQFHRRSQKTRDSWVRDKGPYPSQDVR